MLTQDQITIIKQLHAKGYSYARISEEVGCSKTSVYSVLHFEKKGDPVLESARSELKVMQMQDEVSRLADLRRQREERERLRQSEAEASDRRERGHKERLARIANLKDQILPPALRAYLPLHLQGLTNLVMGRFFSQGGDLLSMTDDEITVFGRLVINQGLQPFAREMQAAVAQFVASTTIETMKALTIEGYFKIYVNLRDDAERRKFWLTLKCELPELIEPVQQIINSRMQVRRVA